MLFEKEKHDLVKISIPPPKERTLNYEEIFGVAFKMDCGAPSAMTRLSRESVFRSKLLMQSRYIQIGVVPMIYKHFMLGNNYEKGIPKKSVIGIEDADTFVSTRDNQNYQMSALLNYIEGVIPTNNKLIISTNLETTNRVDPALLRVGRNFRVLEFRNLTHQEANKARKSTGMKAIKFLPEHKTLSLALALNYENVNAKHFKNHKRQGVGFISRD